jgi:hypothetical protein
MEASAAVKTDSTVEAAAMEAAAMETAAVKSAAPMKSTTLNPPSAPAGSSEVTSCTHHLRA